VLRSPLADPVLVVALGTALFLSVPLVFERLRIPAVIGLILAGAAIGPHGFNLLQRDSTVVLLGTVGLLYLMFMAAVEIDLHGLNRARGPSLVLGGTAFAIPLLLGSTAGRALGYHWNSSILLGSLLASHTLLAYPVATRLGIGKNRAVTAAVGATVITDVLVLVVLSVAEAQASGELGVGFWLRFAGSTTVFLLAVFIGLPRLARAFFRRQDSGEIGEYMFVIAALFASAVLSQAAGLEPIIGAFFAGLALNTFVAEGTPLHNRLQFFGHALLIPFFLLSIGMLVDFRVFA
jgi:Kef-type K+ transport system membrane component KefB